MSKYPLPEEVECIKCEKVGGIHYVSRATWICEYCGKDNSIYYVVLCQAIERNDKS